MATKSKRTSAETPRLRDLVYADLVLRAASGRSVLKDREKISPQTVKTFLPSPEALERSRRQLMELGFQVSFLGPTHITIAGPKALFERVFQVELRQEMTRYTERDRKAAQSYVTPSREATIPDALRELVELVEFPGPINYHAAAPPALAYDHLRVPDDVARDMDALKAHQRGITGTGVNLAMVDSGFLNPIHAYYVGRGYNLQATVSDPLDPNPGTDDIGHGTGIAACALAVAPGCTFLPFKIFGALSAASAAAAFGRAVNANAQIITCSWGVNFSTALQLAINNAVANGIVVCVAAGNGGDVGWPASEPAVIAVGGAFIADNDQISASSYASSGTNANNAGRQVPDLCGIVGNAPSGVCIALPTQSGSQIDTGFAGNPYPNQDTTASNDGWAVFSGTSSASPMVAGVSALILQAFPGLTPAQVRTRLVNSCVDVTAGNSASGQAAAAGVDNATGAGLVQAYRAIRNTDIWLRDNDTNDVGLVPTHGRRPAWPPHAHWTSPDIRVFASPLADPAADFEVSPVTNPVYGQDNCVYVRVRNRGIQATGPVTVGLYYADPSTSLTFPADWKDGQSGVPAEGSLQVGGIGTNQQTVPTIPANAALVIGQPYVLRPPDPTAATQTQVLPDGRTVGHYCLLVRTSSADDPILMPGGGQTSVVDDNNIGMKNVAVYSAPPGYPAWFTFSIRRPRQSEARLHEVAFDLRRLPEGAVVRATPKRGKFSGRWIEARVRGDDVLMRPGRAVPRLTNIGLRPGQSVIVQVEVKLPRATRPGDYSIDVLQLADGRPAGGVRLVARVMG